VSLETEWNAMVAAEREVATIHGELVRERTKLTKSGDSLLSSGWQSIAADEYAEGWAEWQTGAGDVLDALDMMSILLQEARELLQATDDESRHRIETRYAERLGKLE